MEAMIEHGEDWLEPLLEYRDLLASTQDPAVKSQVREFKRRNGRVMVKRDGQAGRGPYRLEFRRQLLRRLLEVQKKIRVEGPNPHEQLIRPDELQFIRRLWRWEEQDWEDSLPKIYREVTGEELEWLADEQPVFSGEERSVLDRICQQHDVPAKLVAKLLDIERQYNGMSRRSAIHQKIAAAIDEDWRSDAEITAMEVTTGL